MFVAAAVCPHPPLLLPEVAQGRDAELMALREACLDAVAHLLAQDPEVVVCVGAGPHLRTYDETHGGAMRTFGVDARAGGAGPDDLPPALTVGAWLLDQAGWLGPRRYVALPPDTAVPSCAEMGTTVAAADLRVGVLAMGDGSARRSLHAPGYLDERAEPFDVAVVRALGVPDPQWLLEDLEPSECADLWVAGRAAWQFLAGSAASRPEGTALEARLRYDAAPYGVGYFAADWSVSPVAG